MPLRQFLQPHGIPLSPTSWANIQQAKQIKKRKAAARAFENGIIREFGFALFKLVTFTPFHVVPIASCDLCHQAATGFDNHLAKPLAASVANIVSAMFAFVLGISLLLGQFLPIKLVLLKFRRIKWLVLFP